MTRKFFYFISGFSSAFDLFGTCYNSAYLSNSATDRMARNIKRIETRLRKNALILFENEQQRQKQQSHSPTTSSY